MNRSDRLKGYANPMKGPHGAGRDPAKIDYWSDRAKQNSKIAPRASDGEMKLPSTGKRTDLRKTTSSPRTYREIDKRMAGKSDLNHTGSSYMKSIRRDA
jgi:hypothetical protein